MSRPTQTDLLYLDHDNPNYSITLLAPKDRLFHETLEHSKLFDRYLEKQQCSVLPQEIEARDDTTWFELLDELQHLNTQKKRALKLAHKVDKVRDDILEQVNVIKKQSHIKLQGYQTQKEIFRPSAVRASPLRAAELKRAQAMRPKEQLDLPEIKQRLSKKQFSPVMHDLCRVKPLFPE